MDFVQQTYGHIYVHVAINIDRHSTGNCGASPGYQQAFDALHVVGTLITDSQG